MKRLLLLFIRAPRKLFRISRNLLEHIYCRFFYKAPKINIEFESKRYFLQDDFSDLKRIYKELFPDKVEAKIKEADLICEHIFDLLGSGPKHLENEGRGTKGRRTSETNDPSSFVSKSYKSIPWHVDFKSWYSWDSKTFCKNIRYGHQEGVDVKVPWELSRFQYLPILGQAYILTKDKKYAEEFKNQLNDWIDNNPVCFGVNWACTMDAAIRAVNLLVSMEYFSEDNLLPQDFIDKFYLSVYEHGKFIRSHLEYSPILTSNHYLSDIAGLFLIAVYCPFFEESKQWISFSKKELENEMQKQVYSDGCDFEASTSYHRLVLEMFFYCEMLGRMSGMEFSENYKSRLRKMFEFSLYCIKLNGFIPQIGDNDSGRFLILSKRPVLEHKYLLSLASIYYKDSDFKLPEFNFDEEAFWGFGLAGKKLYDDLPARKDPLRSKSFPEAGWYIMRHNNDYCFISCGPNGQNGNGGHAHNDKLSFDLMLNGEDVIVDPGTYVYTPYSEERNKFRSTGYHNTIKFNGYEQNGISKNNLFYLHEKCKIIYKELKDDNSSIIFDGEIEYTGITHKRKIFYDIKSDQWRITDELNCSNIDGAELIFHLSPDVIYENDSISLKKTNSKIARFEVRGFKLEKKNYDYSPEYGKIIKAECLVVKISGIKNNKMINTFISKI